MSPFNAHLNVAVQHIAARLFPRGFDVAPTGAPETFETLAAHVAETGRMLVWSGGSDHTVFGCPETNWAFRAWHDWCHLSGGFAFDAEGEAKACELQQAHIRTLFGKGPRADAMCALLDAEVNGQVAFLTEHGDFPTDQRACAVAWLAARGRAADGSVI